MKIKHLFPAAAAILGLFGAAFISHNNIGNTHLRPTGGTNQLLSQIRQDPFVLAVRQALETYHSENHTGHVPENTSVDTDTDDTSSDAGWTGSAALLETVRSADWTVSISFSEDILEISAYTVPETVASSPEATCEWAADLITEEGKNDYFCDYYTGRRSSSRIILLCFAEESNDERIPFSDGGDQVLLYRQGRQAYLARLVSSCPPSGTPQVSQQDLWNRIMRGTCDTVKDVRRDLLHRTCFLYQDIKTDELEEYGCTRRSTRDEILDWTYTDIPFGGQAVTGTVTAAPADSIHFYQMKLKSADCTVLQTIELDDYRISLQDRNGDGYTDLVEKEGQNPHCQPLELRAHLWNPDAGQFLLTPYALPLSDTPPDNSSRYTLEELNVQLMENGYEPVVEYREWSTPEWPHPLIRFTLCGRNSEDMDIPAWFYLMEVFSDEKEAEPAAKMYLNFYNPISVGYIDKTDFNFDNIPDLCINHHTLAQNEVFTTLVWQERLKTFAVIGIGSRGISADAEQNAIQCWNYGGASYGSWDLYQWFPGSLRRTGEIVQHTDWLGETVKYEFFAWEYQNGKAQEKQLVWEAVYSEEEFSQELEEQALEDQALIRDWIIGKYADAAVEFPADAGTGKPENSDAFSLIYNEETHTYSYRIFSLQGGVLEEKADLSGNVYLEELPGNLVHLQISAGPEAKMDWYFDRKTGRKSEMFWNVSAVRGRRIAYMDQNGSELSLIVQDMFEPENGFWRLERDFSPVAAGVSVLPYAAFLTDDALLVHYLSGETYELCREIVHLPDF